MTVRQRCRGFAFVASACFGVALLPACASVSRVSETTSAGAERLSLAVEMQIDATFTEPDLGAGQGATIIDNRSICTAMRRQASCSCRTKSPGCAIA